MEAQDFLKNHPPLSVFEAWWKEARETSTPPLKHAEAFTLATVGADGAPSARVVLLKELRQNARAPSENGLVFYTNYESRKGREIENEPRVSASFYWDALARQVLFRGVVKKLSPQESQKYWDSRPRASQLSQWVSKQSEPVASRESMEADWASAEEKFKNQNVPRPPHWGGYLLTPTVMEFWIGREGRFHDRYVYTLENSQWKGARLYP